IIPMSKSADVAWALIEDFRWYEEDVIILNLPDSYAGAVLFGSASDISSFAKTLYLTSEIDRREHIISIYDMNYNLLSDGVRVTQISPHHYRIEMNQWGGWWWKNKKGAINFETEEVKTVVNNSVSYDLYVKETAQDRTLIYSDGLQWHEFKKQP
ncbi:MAG: hypothetical protein ACPG4Z_07795, partial [Chitinophagales bacterium]